MAYATEDYVARDDNGDVTSTVKVHTVSADEAGEYVNTTAGYRKLAEDDVLVGSDNPNYWDVFDADSFGKLGYESVTQETPAAVDPTPADTAPAADPNADPNATDGGV